jgi:LacI family transcriptional regulator
VADACKTIVVRLDLLHNYGVRAMVGISRMALALNWRIIVEQVDTLDTKRIDWLGKNVDGLIVESSVPADALLAELDFPVVNISGTHSDRLTTLTTDDEAVGRVAAEHLMGLPLAYFAYLGQPGRAYSADRERGFTRALHAAGHECQRLETWVLTEMLAWLKALPKPVGLMVANDIGAAQLLRGCVLTGYDVRELVAMVGVDNEARICESTQPTLSSVDQQAEWIGYQATAMLKEMMQGQCVEKYQLVAPGSLVVRDSSRLTVMHPDVAHALTVIRQNATRFTGVEDLLTHVPMSRRTLERRFQETIGKSPLDEINRVRLSEARRLLGITDLSVAEIARRSGFSSASWLGKAMRSESGQTPTAYRQTIRRTTA